MGSMSLVGIDEEEALAITEALIGVADGIAGLDSDGNIIGTVEHRVDTAANLAAITLADGELAVTSDTNDLLRGDGTTAGGIVVRSGARRYTGSGEITTQLGGSSSLVLNIPVVAGGIYDISGVFGFAGDTDNLSNLFVQSNVVSTVLDTTLDTYTATIVCEYSWIHATGVASPDYRMFTPTALPHTGTINFTPIALTQASGKCSFRMRFVVSSMASGNYRFSFYLRTAKSGSPTIMAGYDIIAKRLK